MGFGRIWTWMEKEGSADNGCDAFWSIRGSKKWRVNGRVSGGAGEGALLEAGCHPAISARTSAWQASGAHQHASTLPRNSRRAASTRAGWVKIHARYLAITCALVPSRPMVNGLPHFEGLPT